MAAAQFAEIEEIKKELGAAKREAEEQREHYRSKFAKQRSATDDLRHECQALEAQNAALQKRLRAITAGELALTPPAKQGRRSPSSSASKRRRKSKEIKLEEVPLTTAVATSALPALPPVGAQQPTHTHARTSSEPESRHARQASSVTAKGSAALSMFVVDT